MNFDDFVIISTVSLPNWKSGNITQNSFMLRALFFVEFYENIVFKITMLKILINIKTNTKTTF